MATTISLYFFFFCELENSYHSENGPFNWLYLQPSGTNIFYNFSNFLLKYWSVLLSTFYEIIRQYNLNYMRSMWKRHEKALKATAVKNWLLIWKNELYQFKDPPLK